MTINNAPQTSEPITMRQASKLLGVKSQTLRRYCNRGFVPGLRHTLPGQTRTFTPDQIDWLRAACFLTRAGFTTGDLRKYIRLANDNNPEAMRQRKAMLATHKRQVWQELEDLQATIDYIERQEDTLT